MCGIALVVNGTDEEVMAMGKAIGHRGKIHHDIKHDNMRVHFSWLPITDRNAPLPPLHYKHPLTCRHYQIWLNGFISNWRELAAKYEIEMKSECDTELLIKFIAEFGQTKLHELNGFFAVVYIEEGELKFFTDRYGIKQLYTYRRCDKFYLASEVKAILAVCPEIELDEAAVADWKYSLGVMTRDTIYQGIKRVRRLPFYFPVKQMMDYEAAKEKLRSLFWKSIERNKVDRLSDGVFLSGGVDSGLLAKALQPDFCFSMDYQDAEFSEAENIKLNSSGIHYSMICNRQLFEKYKHETMEALDDLKAGSCYTNFALTEMASKFCTVLYSGAGGDELFNGYTHRYNREINEVIRRTPLNPLKGTLNSQYCITHKEYDWRFLRAVLVVEDRMSGYHTMETRYPFLDNDLVDFVLSLPDEYLTDKRILKDISGLDEKILRGKKRGFSNPYCTNKEWIDFTLNNLQHGPARHLQRV